MTTNQAKNAKTAGVRPSLGQLLFALLLCSAPIAIAIAAPLLQPSPAERAAAEAAETKRRTAWIPKGFTAVNDEVAFKWSEAGSFTCRYGRCFQAEVVSRNGCDNLYAELGLLSENGANVGYTNDSTSGLAPNQKAILQFNFFNDAATKGQLNEIKCY